MDAIFPRLAIQPPPGGGIMTVLPLEPCHDLIPVDPSLWLRSVEAGTGRGDQPAAGGQERRRHLPHRLRQISLLSVAGTGPAPPDPGDLPPDRTDARSARLLAQQGDRRRHPRLQPDSGGEPPGDAAGQRRPAQDPDDLGGAAQERTLSPFHPTGAAVNAGGGRGPLHFGMGPQLSPRLPQAA